MNVVSVETMRRLDALTIAAGTPGRMLMERAGVGAAREMMTFLEARLAPAHRRRFLVLAGKGNNGGDAYVVARWLAEHRHEPVTIGAVCALDELSGDAREHAGRLPKDVSVNVIEKELPNAWLTPGTVVVDGLLGTGVSGPLRPPYDRIVEQINSSALPVVAIDIPSGLNGDTGKAERCMTADLTVTMAFPKTGLLSAAGRPHCGALRIIDIGVQPDAEANAASGIEAVTAADAAALLTRRPADSHKNVFGHLLVVGGSRLYGGAPLLAAAGALRSGVGLVTVAMPIGASPGHTLNALIVRRLDDAGTGFLNSASRPGVLDLLPTMQAAVFGPGTGPRPESGTVLAAMLAGDLPLVIDADGLRRFAASPDLAAGRRCPVILTPHPGEMKALIEAFGLDHLHDAARRDVAAAVAEASGCHIVLKGLGTVMACPDGRCAISTSGTAALATAGTGDVLAGVLGSLLAQGLDPWDAMRLGVFVHGMAAELAPNANRALTADDLPDLIGTALNELSPFA